MSFRRFLSRLLILFFGYIILTNVPYTYGWYGAGSSLNWPNAYDGLIGRQISTNTVPPDTYTVSESIPFVFRLENPRANSLIESKKLYLKLFRITFSPLTQNLGDNSAANMVTLSEAELYQNNNNGNDAQTLFKSQQLANIDLAGGQSQTFSTTISIDKPGYYQYDVTDIPPSQGYIPGHIYVAGFLRVVLPSSNATDSEDSSPLGLNKAPQCLDKPPQSAPIITSVIPGENSATVIWTEAEDPVTSYLIAYGTSTENYIYGNPNVGGKNTNSYTIAGLSGGKQYYIVVRAENNCAPGIFSQEATTFVSGASLNGNAAGFNEDILGTASVSAETGLVEEIPDRNIFGVSNLDLQESCSTCRYAIYLFVINCILSSIYGYFCRDSIKWRSVFLRGLLIPVSLGVIFYVIEVECRGTVWYCRYFTFIIFSVYLVTMLIFKKLLSSKRPQ